jgi:hypothetical protein
VETNLDRLARRQADRLVDALVQHGWTGSVIVLHDVGQTTLVQAATAATHEALKRGQLDVWLTIRPNVKASLSAKTSPEELFDRLFVVMTGPARPQ